MKSWSRRRWRRCASSPSAISSPPRATIPRSSSPKGSKRSRLYRRRRIFLFLRFGGKRQSGQARLVHEQRARPTEEKEDHQPPQGLSRRNHRGGFAHGAGEQSAGFRPADRGDFAYGLSAPLPLRAGGRDRRGIRAAIGGGTRRTHSQG